MLEQESLLKGPSKIKKSPKTKDVSIDIPDISGTLDNIDRALKVTVIHGAQDDVFDLAGHSVASIRENFEYAFGIPKDAKALVDGQFVNEDFVVEGNMVVEFIQSAGVKGCNLLLANVLG